MLKSHIAPAFSPRALLDLMFDRSFELNFDIGDRNLELNFGVGDRNLELHGRKKEI